MTCRMCMVTVVLSFMLTLLLLMFSGYLDDVNAVDVKHFDALVLDLSFRSWD